MPGVPAIRVMDSPGVSRRLTLSYQQLLSCRYSCFLSLFLLLVDDVRLIQRFIIQGSLITLSASSCISFTPMTSRELGTAAC